MRTLRPSLSCLRSLAWLLAQLCCAAPAVCTAIEPDFLMDSDPELHIPQPVANFDPAFNTLWIAALERPEIDMQRMAAETIARAHQVGIPDLANAVPRLEQILLDESSHPAARFAAARALIVLDARSSGKPLFDASQAFGADLRQLVEPALARWNCSPAAAVWIARLDDPEVRTRDLVLAIRGLGQIGESSALPRLVSIAGELTREPDIRLEAAAAAGQIADANLELDADRLARDTRISPVVNQLCAVRLLARHDGDDARQLLIDLAGLEEPVVAAAALTRLNEIDSALVAPLAESAMHSRDPHVRQQGATAYLRRPTVDRIAPLSQLLADPHPGVRRDVCNGLLDLSANPELNTPVRDAVMSMLAGDRWQGQEQAALLLGALEHQPAANRLVELLESPRREVMVSSAWALRKVAVPETIPALIDKATRQTERRKQALVPGAEHQIAHLFEALGVLQASDALLLLRLHFPKPSSGRSFERARAAAFWAVGRIKVGTPDPELVAVLNARINDFPEQNPESDLVKQMCAVSLGRMQAVDQASMMRGLATNRALSFWPDAALRWAVRELTGEELPPPNAPETVTQGDWFLVPSP